MRTRMYAVDYGDMRMARDEYATIATECSSVPDLHGEAVRGCMSARAQNRRANRSNASYLVRFLALFTICVL